MTRSVLAAEGFLELADVRPPSGVYVLLGACGEALYVGQSNNVFARLMSHTNARKRGRVADITAGDVRVRPIPFVSVMVKLCPVAELDRLEKEYIARLNPSHNIRVLRPLPEVKVDLRALAQRAGVERPRRRPVAPQATRKSVTLPKVKFLELVDE